MVKMVGRILEISGLQPILLQEPFQSFSVHTGFNGRSANAAMVFMDQVHKIVTLEGFDVHPFFLFEGRSTIRPNCTRMVRIKGP